MSGRPSTASEITDFFPEAKNNLTKISWAHAVNNQSLLEDALKGKVIQHFSVNLLKEAVPYSIR